MKELDTQILDRADEGLRQAQEDFGKVEDSKGNTDSLTTAGSLDVLRSMPKDRLGFREIRMPIRDYVRHKQIGNKVLQWLDTKSGIFYPASVIFPEGDRQIRVATIPSSPFVREIGVTAATNFGLDLEAQTQAVGFGSHDPISGASAFEPGHYGTFLAAAANFDLRIALEQRGDRETHDAITAGLPRVLDSAELIPDRFPIPETFTIDLADVAPNAILPLYWFDELENEGEAIAPHYDDVLNLTIGTAYINMSEEQKRIAAMTQEYAIAERV